MAKTNNKKHAKISAVAPTGERAVSHTREHLSKGTPSDTNYITCHAISLQLAVQCHQKKTAPCEMERGSATTDDQFAYFTPGSSKSVYRYKFSTEEWKPLPPSPYSDSRLVIIDGILTTVGGEDQSCYTNKLFSLQRGQWVEHYPPMNTARSDMAVVITADGNYILVIGGGDKNWTAAVELFHIRSKVWYELTNLPQALSRPSAAIYGNQIYVIGGSGTGYSCSLQTLSSSNQPIISQSLSHIITWTLLPQQPVSDSTAATLCGQLVIIGGMQGKSLLNSIHQLINRQWVKIGSMSSSRRLCLVVTPTPEKMMIVGGDGWGEDSVEECFVVSSI